jgi:hypothetical protein
MGKPVIPKNHTHLGQSFSGLYTDKRNPPKHGRSVAGSALCEVNHFSKALASCVGGWRCHQEEHIAIKKRGGENDV